MQTLLNAENFEQVIVEFQIMNLKIGEIKIDTENFEDTEKEIENFKNVEIDIENSGFEN